MASVDLEGIEKVFSSGTRALDGVSLHIAAGEHVILVGPSGSGKTTLLRLIAGLDRPTRGIIRIDGVDVLGRTPFERKVSMVSENPAIWGEKTVADHLRLGPHLRASIAEWMLPWKRRRMRESIDRDATAAAKLLGIDAFWHRRADQLSAGQQQRLALARAILRSPAIHLWDEPLGRLDWPLRLQLRHELLTLHRRLGGTVIHVTHDQREALAIADRIAVLRAGCLEQVGPPEEIYNRPASPFVAGFFGDPPMNLLDGTLVHEPSGWRFTGGAGSLSLGAMDGDPNAMAGPITLGIRPEHITFRPEFAVDISWPARVVTSEYQGSHWLGQLAAEWGTMTVIFRTRPPERDTIVNCHVELRMLHWFGATGQRVSLPLKQPG